MEFFQVDRRAQPAGSEATLDQRDGQSAVAEVVRRLQQLLGSKNWHQFLQALLRCEVNGRRFAGTRSTGQSCCSGRWQSFAGAATPLGAARPGWKVLRVLGNALGFRDFEYQSAEEVRDEVRGECREPLATAYAGSLEPASAPASARVVDVPMYQVDALVRRAPSLQRTRQGRAAPAIYA